MNNALVVALVGLIVVIAVHISVIARWSGRIDAFMTSITERVEKTEKEIDRLRDNRHRMDGAVARHDGALRMISAHGRWQAEEEEG